MSSWNRPSDTPQPQRAIKGKGRLLPCLFAVVAIAALGIGMYFLIPMGSEDGKPDRAEVRKKIRSANAIPVKGKTSEPEVEEKRPVPAPVMPTSPTGDMPQRESMTSNSNAVVAGLNPDFVDSTERLIADIFTTQLGDIPPLIPPTISKRQEGELIAIIGKIHQEKDGDSDALRERKYAVNAAKQELKKFIREGGSVNEFLQYYSKQLMDAHYYYEDCRRAVTRAIKEDPEVGRELVKTLNEKLSEKGIKELKLTNAQKLKIGITEEDANE